MKIHIVQKGDTLWKIAKKYGVNFEELKKMNTQLSNPDMIMPGMKIKVPTTGGSIKKEAPIGGMPDTKINMGAKKEMPKAEHPFTKEKPITKPVAEAPKEKPVKEQPKPAPPKVEAPKPVPPKVEAPKEVPKKPFTPKMPILPEIDINNYYMMNMTNLPAQQPAPQLPPKPTQQLPPKPTQQLPPKPAQKPAQQLPPKPAKQPAQKPAPQLPPKPKNILPQIKPIAEEEYPEAIENESPVYTQQGGYYQPMYPNQPFYPVSPATHGPGFQGGYPQQQFPHQQMPFPQVQGAAMPMQQMAHHGMMAGVESPNYDESSPFMPYMPQQQLPLSPIQTLPAQLPPQAQMPAPVMGAEDYNQQLPHQPTYTAPVMQQPYPCPPPPCPPYPCPPLMPVSPVMPGSGFCGPVPYGQMPYGHPQMGAMPQVQGVMDESPGMSQMPLMPSHSQMPLMPSHSQMPLMPSHSQMPLMPSESQMPLMPHQAVQGAESDCGCGGGAPQILPGSYGPGYPGHQVPHMPGHHMGYGHPQQMNPYGYGPMGGQAFGMPRDFEESSEFGG